MKHHQQGDVILHHINSLPPNLEDEKQPVIQHGEVTGHRHVINAFKHGSEENFGTGGNWQLLTDKSSGLRYLRVGDGGVDVSHEEHKTIHVPPGNYRIGIVREADHIAGVIRQVQD